MRWRRQMERVLLVLWGRLIVPMWQPRWLTRMMMWRIVKQMHVRLVCRRVLRPGIPRPWVVWAPVMIILLVVIVMMVIIMVVMMMVMVMMATKGPSMMVRHLRKRL